MFFASPAAADTDAYRVVLDVARAADERGFSAVWTPERHFARFGGIFPNPALTSAALAMVTRRVQLRAGSLISPLHHTLRIAEDWAVVDRLSGGRVAISFGSGWNADDFALAPERYADRQAVMFEQIAAVRGLWRGEPWRGPNGQGRIAELELHPRPIQRELPVWVTSSGSPSTFVRAGASGYNVLTHLIGQGRDQLAANIRRYRDARAEHGHDPAAGRVSLMLHTFVGLDRDEVLRIARPALHAYLALALALEQRAADAGGVMSGRRRMPEREALPPGLVDEMLDVAVDRYLTTAALIGTLDDVKQTIAALARIGVDELACLLDFGVPATDLFESLDLLSCCIAANTEEPS
jgi:natural product biosynthesis luciferase-like monooxygenase protein